MKAFCKIKEWCFESPQIGSKRDNTADEIAGWLIILVILLHTGFVGDQRYSLYHCFFYLMPWFFFKSGIYDKDKPFHETVRKEFKRLIVPYLFFSLFALITTTVVAIPNGISECLNALWHNACLIVKQTLLKGTSRQNYPLWFLTSLFACKCISSLVKSKYRWLVCVIAIIVAVLHNKYMVHEQRHTYNYIYIGNIALGLLYYNLGAIIKGKQYSKMFFALCATAYVLVFVFVPSNIDMMQNYLTFGYYMAGVIFTVCGIVTLNNVARYLPVFKPFAYIGRNSMALYVTHWPLMYLFFHYYPSNIAFLIFLVVISPLLIYLTKKYPFVFGK